MKPLPSRLSIVTNCRCFKIISDETPTFQTIYINKLLLLFEIISDQTPSTFHTVNMLQDHFWPNSSLPFRLSMLQDHFWPNPSLPFRLSVFTNCCCFALRSSVNKPLSTFQTVCTFILLPGNPTLLRTLEYSVHHLSIPCSVVSALSLIRLPLPGTNS